MSNQAVNPFAKNGATPGGSAAGETISIPDYSGAVDPVYYAPPGTYRAKCTKVVQGLSKSSNNPMITFSMDVDLGNSSILKKSIYVPLGAASYRKMKNVCVALKIPPKTDITTAKIAGRECYVVVVDQDEKYQDEVQCEIKRCLPLDADIVPAQASSAWTEDQPLPPGPEDDVVPF